MYLTKDKVPENLRGGYAGTKFRVEVCEKMTIPIYAELWDGGSRNHYTIRDINTGDVVMPVLLKYQQTSPFNEARQDHELSMEPGFVVIKHSIFCGKDLGLTIYVHPDAVDRLALPAPVKLTTTEHYVLVGTVSYKSKCMNKDRYDMVTDQLNMREKVSGNLVFKPTRDEWNNAKDSLIEKKLLNRAGAITVAGRNAVGGARL